MRTIHGLYNFYESKIKSRHLLFLWLFSRKPDGFSAILRVHMKFLTLLEYFGGGGLSVWPKITKKNGKVMAHFFLLLQNFEISWFLTKHIFNLNVRLIVHTSPFFEAFLVLIYAHHHNLHLITSPSWLFIVHKAMILRKKNLKKIICPTKSGFKIYKLQGM